MKIKIIGGGMAACLVAALLSGCGNKETSPAPPGEAQEAVESAPTNAAETAPIATKAEETAAKAATATTQAVSQAATEVSTQTAAVATKVQNLIDQAKNLVAEKKYQDALDTLKQLGNFQLTPDQQKTVDNLKAQIQNLMSNQTVSNVVNSAGNLLGK